MFYLITIIISIILWIWFFYIKSTREYDGKPIKFPVWFYLIGLVLLFVPFFSFLFPFIFTLCTGKDAYIWFSDKWTFDRMLYSFKPLKLEYWFTEEEIREIKR